MWCSRRHTATYFRNQNYLHVNALVANGGLPGRLRDYASHGAKTLTWPFVLHDSRFGTLTGSHLEGRVTAM